MNNIKIGLVVADTEEYVGLYETIKEFKDIKEIKLFGHKGHQFTVDNKTVISVLCGIGKVNAAMATTALIDNGCNIILNYGLSGGVYNVSRGEVIAPDSFVEHDFDMTGIGYKPFQKPAQEIYVYNADKKLLEITKKVINNNIVSTAVSGDSFICDSKSRDFLKDNFGTSTCDMETAAIASVCHFGKVPFATVRKVSDDAGEDAKDSYREMNNLNETALPIIMIHIIKNIGEI